MANIGTLAVTVAARTQKFRKGMGDARGTVNKFALSVRKSLSVVKLFQGALIGIAGGAVLGKLTSSFRATAQEIDKLAKTSSKLGLATDQLQFLRFAAEQTGVKVRTMDLALQRMTRRIAEAGKGTGEARNAIKELGLDAQQLARLSPDQQFLQIAEAMKRVASQGDRVRLGFKLFDSEGVGAVNTLMANLTQLRAEFDKLGVAVSAENAAKLEKFNDEMNKLAKLLGGIKQDFVINISGPAVDAIRALQETVQGIQLILASLPGAKSTGAPGLFSARGFKNTFGTLSKFTPPGAIFDAFAEFMRRNAASAGPRSIPTTANDLSLLPSLARNLQNETAVLQQIERNTRNKGGDQLKLKTINGL